MLNRGLLMKSFLETRGSVIGFGLGLGMAMAALTAIIPQFQGNLNHMLETMPFLRTILSSLLGLNVDKEITAQMLQSFVWVHPVVLALVWACAIIWCTRIPCGEVDRGTIDVLLGWPVSRRDVTLAETVIVMVNGLVVILLGVIGHLIVSRLLLTTEDAPGWGVLFGIVLNMYLLFLAVGGVAWFCSNWMERRGRAVGLSFALVVISFLINFLAQFWSVAEHVAWLSLLQYYQPAFSVREDAWPIGDLVVLAVVAVVTWLAGALVFERRAIHTT